MTVKEWLLRAYKIDQQIASKYEQIEMWRSLAAKLSSSTIKVQITKNGNNVNKVEIYCIKIADAEAEIERQLSKLLDIKREISEAINKLESSTYRVLLEQRYILCKNWNEIAEFMHYDESYILKKLHPLALREIEQFVKISKTDQ